MGRGAPRCHPRGPRPMKDEIFHEIYKFTRMTMILFLRVITSYYELLRVITSYYELLRVITSFYELLRVIMSCYELLRVFMSYYE